MRGPVERHFSRFEPLGGELERVEACAPGGNLVHHRTPLLQTRSYGHTRLGKIYHTFPRGFLAK